MPTEHRPLISKQLQCQTIDTLNLVTMAFTLFLKSGEDSWVTHNGMDDFFYNKKVFYLVT